MDFKTVLEGRKTNFTWTDQKVDKNKIANMFNLQQTQHPKDANNVDLAELSHGQNNNVAYLSGTQPNSAAMSEIFREKSEIGSHTYTHTYTMS